MIGNLPDPSRHFSDTHQKGSSPATPLRGDVLFEKGFSLGKTSTIAEKTTEVDLFSIYLKHLLCVHSVLSESEVQMDVLDFIFSLL